MPESAPAAKTETDGLAPELAPAAIAHFDCDRTPGPLSVVISDDTMSFR